MKSVREIPGHLEVVDNVLHIGGVGCVELAERFGTPTYVYNIDRVLDNFDRLRGSLERHADREVAVYYAVKANFNPFILRALAEHGAHADVLSVDEARFASAFGFDVGRIMFTGTSVSDRAMRYLLDAGALINIDSFSQMRRLARLAPRGLEVSIRWNPGTGAGFTPEVITAGAESHGRPIKFGIEESRILEAFGEAADLGMDPIGLHQHIGSGWTGGDVEHFLETVDSTLSVAGEVTELLGRDLMQVDFGGGSGIPYGPDQERFPVDAYGRGICDRVRRSGLGFDRICVESGRYIVGDAGVLLTEVNTVETKNGNPIIGVDAGFNALLRPAFYGGHDDEGNFHEAYHEVVVADRVEGRRGICTVAGPVCETGDLLAIKRPMTRPEEGEVLAILDAGAYGYSMSSFYNLLPRPAEVIVPDARLVTGRETFEDLIGNYTQEPAG